MCRIDYILYIKLNMYSLTLCRFDVITPTLIWSEIDQARLEFSNISIMRGYSAIVGIKFVKIN